MNRYLKIINYINTKNEIENLKLMRSIEGMTLVIEHPIKLLLKKNCVVVWAAKFTIFLTCPSLSTYTYKRAFLQISNPIKHQAYLLSSQYRNERDEILVRNIKLPTIRFIVILNFNTFFFECIIIEKKFIKITSFLVQIHIIM